MGQTVGKGMDDLVRRWQTDEGQRVTRSVLAAVRGQGDWSESIYDFTGSSVKSPRIDLRGIILRQMDLRGTDLSNLELSAADFTKSDLSGADLQRSNLDGAVFKEANLTEANLVGCSARGAIFVDANLSRAFGMHGNFASAIFERANLTDTSLAGSLGRKANLSRARLVSTDLEMSDWRGANIRGVMWSAVRDTKALLPRPGIRSRTPDTASWLVMTIGSIWIASDLAKIAVADVVKMLWNAGGPKVTRTRESSSSLRG
jgi:uncharacterized protein YjbI with pentapeptide repeats